MHIICLSKKHFLNKSGKGNGRGKVGSLPFKITVAIYLNKTKRCWQNH